MAGGTAQWPRETTGTQKSRERRCFPIFGVPRDQLNDWRALTLVAIRVAKKWRAGGGGAEKIQAAVRAFTYCRHLFRLLKPSSPVHCFVIAASRINHENVPPRHSYRPA
jgi:hypothetical protein